MAKITPLHIEYYKFPTNEFINWKDWNYLYDIAYNCQGERNGRHNLMLHISFLHSSVKSKIKSFKFFESKRTRDRKRNTILLKQFRNKQWKK